MNTQRPNVGRGFGPSAERVAVPSRRALSQDAGQRPMVRARARRAEVQGFRWAIAAIVVLCACAVAYVSETATATQASYQINRLKADQVQLRAQQQQIRYQISQASSAGTLDSDASKLGMVRAPSWQYLPGSQDPVALATGDPTVVDQPKLSWLDHLAFALGRPTTAQAKDR